MIPSLIETEKALQYAIALVRGRIPVEAPANAAIVSRYADLLEALLAASPVPQEGMCPNCQVEMVTHVDNTATAITECPKCRMIDQLWKTDPPALPREPEKPEPAADVKATTASAGNTEHGR